MNLHVYVCLQNICMILVIRYLPPLKNEKDRSVEYKNNTKTNQSSIWTSPCTQFLSKRTQM